MRPCLGRFGTIMAIGVSAILGWFLVLVLVFFFFFLLYPRLRDDCRIVDGSTSDADLLGHGR